LIETPGSRFVNRKTTAPTDASTRADTVPLAAVLLRVPFRASLERGEVWGRGELDFPIAVRHHNLPAGQLVFVARRGAMSMPANLIRPNIELRLLRRSQRSHLLSAGV
jgi:hypothetical protein